MEITLRGREFVKFVSDLLTPMNDQLLSLVTCLRTIPTLWLYSQRLTILCWPRSHNEGQFHLSGVRGMFSYSHALPQADLKAANNEFVSYIPTMNPVRLRMEGLIHRRKALPL